MATNFPTSLDSFTNPTSSSTLDSPSHAAQHANINDAVEALEAKVGADSSAVTSSLDYKVDRRSLIWLDDQTFTGFGGVASDVLSSDFTHYLVQWFGTNANSSAMTLQFRRGGSNIATSNYSYGTNGVTFSTGTAFTNTNNSSTFMRIGSINTGVSFMSMFVTLGYSNVAMATWQFNHQTFETWQGSGQFSDGSAVTGLRVARSSGSTTMRMRVYGLRN